jgi:hypothetical protein
MAGSRGTGRSASGEEVHVFATRCGGRTHYLNHNTVLVRLSRVAPSVLKDLLGMAHKFVTADTVRRSTSRQHRKPA